MAVTTASDRIRRLEERDFAERRPNPADGRSSLVSLTPEGQAAFESTWPAWRDAVIALEKELCLPSTQVAEAIRELDRAMRAVLSTRALNN